MSSQDKNLPYEILTLSHLGFKYCSVYRFLIKETVERSYGETLYSRVWNKRTPLNKRSPLENLAKRIIVAPFFTLYYEVRNKAVAPGKKSKN